MGGNTAEIAYFRQFFGAISESPRRGNTVSDVGNAGKMRARTETVASILHVFPFCKKKKLLDLLQRTCADGTLNGDGILYTMTKSGRAVTHAKCGSASGYTSKNYSNSNRGWLVELHPITQSSIYVRKLVLNSLSECDLVNFAQVHGVGERDLVGWLLIA
jgi:hypothetical protein